jgi:hypothetical protein
MSDCFQRGKEDSGKDQKDQAGYHETRNRALAPRYGGLFTAVPFGDFFNAHAASRAPTSPVDEPTARSGRK